MAGGTDLYPCGLPAQIISTLHILGSGRRKQLFHWDNVRVSRGFGKGWLQTEEDIWIKIKPPSFTMSPGGALGRNLAFTAVVAAHVAEERCCGPGLFEPATAQLIGSTAACSSALAVLVWSRGLALGPAQLLVAPAAPAFTSPPLGFWSRVQVPPTSVQHSVEQLFAVREPGWPLCLSSLPRPASATHVARPSLKLLLALASAQLPMGPGHL